MLAGLQFLPAGYAAGCKAERQRAQPPPVVPPSCSAFAAEWERSGRPLHGLLNNAGALTFSKEHNSAGVAQLCQVGSSCSCCSQAGACRLSAAFLTAARMLGAGFANPSSGLTFYSTGQLSRAIHVDQAAGGGAGALSTQQVRVTLCCDNQAVPHKGAVGGSQGWCTSHAYPPTRMTPMPVPALKCMAQQW